MFLDIQDWNFILLISKRSFSPESSTSAATARQRTLLKAAGRAEVVEEHHGKHEIIKDIRLRGRLSTRLELQCARCLEPVPQDIVRDFELLYRPLGADAGRDELSVTAAEAEIGYYQGDGILLEDVLREQVLAGVAPENHLPRRLQGVVPALRQELERRAVLLPTCRWKIRGGRR
jgi:uncharacterized protein